MEHGPASARTPPAVWALYGALAVTSTLLHASFVDTTHWAPIRDEWSAAILAGQGPSPDQYRMLTHWLAAILHRAGLGWDLAYQTIRGGATVAAACLFHRFLAGWFPLMVCVAGTLWLLAFIPFTHLHYYFQPADPLNLVAFLSGYLVIRAGRDGWLAVLLPVGVLNRETVLLLLPCWAFVRYDEMPWRRFLLRGAGLALLAAGAYAGVRAWYGIRPYYTAYYFFLWKNMADPRAWLHLTCLVTPTALALRSGARDRIPRFLTRAAGMLPFLFAVQWTFMAGIEPRIYLPALPLLIALTLAMLVPVRETDGLPAGSVAPPPTPEPPAWLTRRRGTVYLALLAGFCGCLFLFLRYMERTYIRGFEARQALERARPPISASAPSLNNRNRFEATPPRAE